MDFSKYLKQEGNIEIRLDAKFDTNEDFIEKICLVDKSNMTCVTGNGNVVVKELMATGDSTLTAIDTLSIPCPGRLKDGVLDDDLDMSDADGPNLSTSTTGDLIVVLRHFEEGRKIHAYSSSGDLQYTISLDCPHLALEPRPGYVSLDLDGNFICCADQVGTQGGVHLNFIEIPSANFWS